MRSNLVVGNWKMHGSKASVTELLRGLEQPLAELAEVEVAVCVPSLFIPLVADILAGGKLAWGAQTLNENQSGAYTGEISASMLREFGCRYVIVGHSERRTLYAESDQAIAAKYVAAQAAGITPILCFGESLQQREAGETLAWVEQQLQAVIGVAGVESLANAVLAYEPIWAIGTGKTASPEQAQQVHGFIRKWVAKQSPSAAEKLQILYGGSVNAANASELFANPDIDGALVGGASLKVADFAAICQAAN
jgi:triosephosphate isomerase